MVTGMSSKNASLSVLLDNLDKTTLWEVVLLQVWRCLPRRLSTEAACVRPSACGVVESEVTALGYDPRFDLTAATWLLAGIAGTLDCILPYSARGSSNICCNLRCSFAQSLSPRYRYTNGWKQPSSQVWIPCSAQLVESHGSSG